MDVGGHFRHSLINVQCIHTPLSSTWIDQYICMCVCVIVLWVCENSWNIVNSWEWTKIVQQQNGNVFVFGHRSFVLSTSSQYLSTKPRYRGQCPLFNLCLIVLSSFFFLSFLLIVNWIGTLLCATIDALPINWRLLVKVHIFYYYYRLHWVRSIQIETINKFKLQLMGKGIVERFCSDRNEKNPIVEFHLELNWFPSIFFLFKLEIFLKTIVTINGSNDDNGDDVPPLYW